MGLCTNDDERCVFDVVFCPVSDRHVYGVYGGGMIYRNLSGYACSDIHVCSYLHIVSVIGVLR